MRSRVKFQVFVESLLGILVESSEVTYATKGTAGNQALRLRVRTQSHWQLRTSVVGLTLHQEPQASVLLPQGL